MLHWFIGVGVIGYVFALLVVGALACRTYTRCIMGRCKSQNRLDGKVVIITGSNTGIGKVTAEKLAERGARVIMACRNVNKAEVVAERIREKNPKSEVVVMELDLGCFSSIRSFAQGVSRAEKRLDILLNNAGISGGKFKLTDDGFEEVYQTNYLGPFYLTELLMPLLKKSTPARILNVGSSAYLFGAIDPRTFSGEVKCDRRSSFFRYGDSKLAMLMWTRAMAEEIRNTGVTINCIHPGVVSTKIASQSLNISNLLFRINISIFGRTATEGAQTLLYLCLDPIGSERSGEFWTECCPTKVFRSHNSRQDRELLQVTRECLGLHAL